MSQSQQEPDLIIHVIPPTEKIPKPCVQCDAAIRSVERAGLARGVDYAVKSLTDESRVSFKEEGLSSSPVIVSTILNEKVGGSRPDFIKRHVAEIVERAKQDTVAA